MRPIRKPCKSLFWLHEAALHVTKNVTVKYFLFGLISLITLGCMAVAGLPNRLPDPPRVISFSIFATPSNTVTLKPSLTPFQPVTNTPSSPPAHSPEPSLAPTRTRTPRPKPNKKPKPTALPTSESTFHEAGPLTAPIIFYHHVVPGDPPNIYCVTTDAFTEQMDYLQSNGYTAIPISLLVKAIREGADLPDRPVVISFDDGNADIYENAYPIMQKYGFTGTLYLVMNYLDHATFLTSDQAAEMYHAGWEIGSHSMSHPDLVGMQDALTYQVVNSKEGLGDAIGAPVNTFAYPYGETDNDIISEVKQEYSAAVGLGDSYTHSLADIYYLERIEVNRDTDLNSFASALPW
jgi:peptidoglycan/xylan/chitin deacetylase (PgdA/CDA1 family)